MSRLYLAVPELAAAPTGIPWAQLASAQGVTAAQLQQWYCSQVSSLMDNICGAEVLAGSRPYVLAATQDTETAETDTQEQTFIDNHGDLIFLARYRPIINVVAGSWVESLGSGQFGGTPVPFDLSNVAWEGRQITYYGPFTACAVPLRVSVTYVDGFANALLTSAVSAGAASLALDETTGVVAGQELTVFDMPPEQVQVAATWTAASGPGSVPLAAPVANGHAAGVRVSALGADAEQAALLLVQHLVQTRGLVQAQAAWQQLGERTVVAGATNFYELALDLLDQYMVTVF